MTPTTPSSASLRSRLAAAALLICASGAATAQTYFRVNSEGGNTDGSVLTIDHPSLNGKPRAKPLLTQFWSGVYNAHPVGVQYDGDAERWQIVNEDGVAIPPNATFNVLLPKGVRTVLASAANSTGSATVFPTARGNPQARLLTTHVTNPILALPPTYSQRQHGLVFLNSAGSYGNQWAIFTENTENIEAIGFHVADVTRLKNGESPASFIFTAAGGNISSHIATIDNALTNDNPNAFLFVQHVWLPASPTYLNKPIGVYYDGGRWCIFNQDFSAMPENTAFVVLVLPGTGV